MTLSRALRNNIVEEHTCTRLISVLSGRKERIATQTELGVRRGIDTTDAHPPTHAPSTQPSFGRLLLIVLVRAELYLTALPPSVGPTLL